VPPDLAFTAGMGLDAALARFAFTLSLLQEPAAVRRVAAEMCEDAAREGVGTLEIRFAPQLHRGAAPEDVVDAALDGIAGRAGLVLCGLYGEAPTVLTHLVDVAIPRAGVVGIDLAGGPPTVLAHLVDVAIPRAGVVGIDLAGGPAPAQAWGMLDYAPAFRRAADHGIGRTVHAGEGRPPAEIRVAIDALLAQRIGHGTTLLDDPAAVDLVLARGVTIEACPTSNVHTGVIASVADHPLPRWLARGVRACVNTDNTLLSAVDAPEELRRAAAIPGMDAARVATAVANGHAAAFRR
jgi:adenosine deaminase